jgi:hypothetical protein
LGDSQNNWSSGRSVSGAGVGYVNDGPWRLHVEASMLQLGDVGKVGSTGSQRITSDTTQTTVLEGGWDVWVLGLNSSHRVQENEGSDGSSSLTMNGNEFTVGIVPEKGLSLLFHYGSTELNVKEVSNTIKVITTSRALSMIWIF